MTIAKSAASFQASASNSAGGTTTGSWIDLTGAYGCTLDMLITNGGAGPTVGCDAIIEVSPDNGTTVYEYDRMTAGVANGGTYAFSRTLPASVMYARTKFTGNTGQAVTVQADGQKITSL